METKEMTLQEIQDKLGYKVKIVDEKPKKKLVDIEVGKTFKVDDLEFIVLEHLEDDETAIILKDFWKTDRFDKSTNDYEQSSIRKELNSEFFEQLGAIVGKENILLHRVDLTSDDGRVDYGCCHDVISLLTCDMYRKYVYILDKYKPDDWWWLATAYSTKSNGYERSVRCVDYGGTLRSNCYYYSGVRPFCILKSNIFVSE